MKTEKQKMLSGELYNALDEELTRDRILARNLLKSLNEGPESPPTDRRKILSELIGKIGTDTMIQPPFYCDYGYNITLGDGVFFNFNCVVLDVHTVSIGHRTLIGPGVHIYTATHPMDYRQRAKGLELGKPVVIGEDVWIGGGAIVCPGVTIGDRSVIGAGSIVTKDIPPNVFAAGNPCKVIRELHEM